MPLKTSPSIKTCQQSHKLSLLFTVLSVLMILWAASRFCWIYAASEIHRLDKLDALEHTVCKVEQCF